jgi:DNA polymerase elongation subunit (family B)
LVSAIEDADVVVTYNGATFDFPLIQGAIGHSVLPRRHADLWQVLTNSSPDKAGWSLDAVCRRTFGYGKTGSGAAAPRLFQEGKWGALFTYCLDDVQLMRRLFWHMIDPGTVPMLDGTPVKPHLRRRLLSNA